MTVSTSVMDVPLDGTNDLPIVNACFILSFLYAFLENRNNKVVVSRYRWKKMEVPVCQDLKLEASFREINAVCEHANRLFCTTLQVLYFLFFQMYLSQFRGTNFLNNGENILKLFEMRKFTTTYCVNTDSTFLIVDDRS